jgi:hypothetical protein
VKNKSKTLIFLAHKIALSIIAGNKVLISLGRLLMTIIFLGSSMFFAVKIPHSWE